MKYRPSIDGLRAIAVLGVLVYHLEAGILPGGFVGVDIFFVISGFLITSQLYDSSMAGGIRYGEFYGKRVARLFPALFAVVCSTLLVAQLVYPGEDIASTGAAAVATVLWTANIKFALQGDYFEMTPDTQPLLHMWSLGVEEQFYLCFPLLVGFITSRTRNPHFLFYVVIGLATASFLACLALTHYHPTLAFYLLPTRAWELLCGAAIAIGSRLYQFNLPGSRFYPLIGGVGTLLCFGILNASVGFPGAAATLPVLSAALIIVGDIRCNNSQVLQALEVKWLTGIGRLSYSLYLWHWPVYAFTDYTALESSPSVRLVVKATATIALASLSYKFIENPCRRYLNREQTSVRSVTIGLVGSAVICLPALHMWHTSFLDSSLAKARRGGICCNSQATEPIVVLYGDSIGSSIARAMANIAEETGFRLHVMSVAGENPYADGRLLEESLAWLDLNKPDVIVVATAWSNAVPGENRVNKMLQQLKPTCSTLIALGQPPILPDAGRRRSIRRNGLQTIREERKWEVIRKNWAVYFATIESEEIQFVSLDEYFKNSSGEIRVTGEGGRQLYQDYLHLSEFGAHIAAGAVASQFPRDTNSRERQQ